jgi:anti-anti-sigma regulatory factor
MTESTWLTVDLGTEPGIKTVVALREALAEAIANSEQVLVRGDQVERIDISALQILAAAHSTASAAGRTIKLSAPTDGPLALALKRSGFVGADGTPQTREGAFWTLSTAAKDEAA